MHPLLRNAVISLVGLIIAAALTALALVNRNSDLSVLGLAVAGVLGTLIGIFGFSQGWIWASRAARQHQTGSAVLIAIGGGLAGLLAGLAFGLLVILVRLFYLG